MNSLYTFGCLPATAVHSESHVLLCLPGVTDAVG